MKPESSFPCSQDPAAGPRPEPVEFNPHPPILFLIQNNIPQYSQIWNFWIKNCYDFRDKRNMLRSEVSGSHGGEYEDGCLLGCFAV
jgi:hypothetical protein